MLSIPSSRQARMIRRAISPRFAINSRRITSTVPRRLPLFEKSAQALLTFLRDAPRGDRPGRERHRVVDRAPPDEWNQRFRGRHRFRSGCQKLCDVAGDGVIELVGWYDGVHETDLF